MTLSSLENMWEFKYSVATITDTCYNLLYIMVNHKAQVATLVVLLLLFL